MKINKDWRSVFKRYSVITHVMSAVSSVGLLAITPFIGYIPLWVSASVTGVLALLGILGSFIKQEVAEDKEDDCKLDKE